MRAPLAKIVGLRSSAGIADIARRCASGKAQYKYTLWSLGGRRTLQWVPKAIAGRSQRFPACDVASTASKAVAANAIINRDTASRSTFRSQ